MEQYKKIGIGAFVVGFIAAFLGFAKTGSLVWAAVIVAWVLVFEFWWLT